MKKSAVHHALGMLKWATVLPSGCSQQQFMESGGGGLPEKGAPLKRMASSTESESAFSTATEAESEMTGGADYEEGQSVTPRQTYFLCYATDCLSAYESIKKRSLSGLRALDDVSSIDVFVQFVGGSGASSRHKPFDSWDTIIPLSMRCSEL